MTRMATNTEITEEEQQLVRGLRKRKMDLLEEIEMIKNELKEVDNELESMYFMDDSGKARLKILANARRKFNKDPLNGIQYLSDRGLLDRTPKAIAEWVYQGDGLAKSAIGDLIGGHDDLAINILKQYTRCFDLAGLFLVDALRIYLKSFRLPGESQKIDRIMDAFSHQYVQANPHVFPSADACHTVAFSTILLNTLLYNPNVKDKITSDGYVDMCREYLEKKWVTVDILTQIYDSIKNAEFALPLEDNGAANIHLNADREGWLYKQSSGQFVGPLAWKRRWFVLSEQCLYYFEQTTDNEPRGIIPLQNVGIRRVEASSRPHMFEIYSLSDDRIKACKTEQDGRVVEGRHSVYRICAANQEDLREVVFSLRDARWASGGVEPLQANGGATAEIEEEMEEFDPFKGLDDDNIVCSSCKFPIGKEEDRATIVSHYQSVWHRHNLRRIGNGKNPVSEQDFEDGDDDTAPQSDEEEEELVVAGRSRVFFTQNDDVYSIYRCILHQGEDFPSLSTFLLPIDCAVFLLAGGHFAGAVFKGDRMTVHKTIARYVVRAKQGGAQSGNDNSKGNAHSAGAALRRYNERTLRSEISQLISAWKEEIASVPLVFIRCASYQRSAFQVDGVLEKSDPRIRNIPFETKRPSIEELKATQERFSRVYEHGSREDFLKSLEAERRAKKPTALQKKKKEEDNHEVKIDDERETNPAEERKKDHLKPVKPEEPKEDPWPSVPRELRTRLYELVRENNATALKTEVESAKNVSETLAYLDERKFAPDGSTFLHMAASRGLDDVLMFLLEVRCDPGVKNDEGKVPISVSLNKKTKAIFIEYRENNPSAWPWPRTHIPVIEELTEEQKERMAEKKKDKKQRQKERLKEKKQQQKEEEEEQRAKEAYLNLPEREKRAMAAEARFGTITRCVNCGEALPPVPFEYNSIKLCTPACVAAHRSRQEASST